MVVLPFSKFQEIVNNYKVMENDVETIKNTYKVDVQRYVDQIKLRDNKIIEDHKVNSALTKKCDDADEILNCVTDDNRKLKIITGVIGVAAIICVGYTTAPFTLPIIAAKMSILKAGTLFLVSKQTLAGAVATTTLVLAAASKTIPLEQL